MTTVDIVARQAGKCGAGAIGERGIAFQRHDAAGQPRQHGRRVAGAGADIENGFARADFGKLHQLGEWRRLHQIAPGSDLDVLVDIGERAPPFIDEGFARDASIASMMAGSVTSVVRTCPSTIFVLSSEKSAFMSPHYPSRRGRMRVQPVETRRRIGRPLVGAGGLARN